VNAAAELFNHCSRLSSIARLSKDSSVQGNNGVGAEDDAIGEPCGHFSRLQLSVKQAKFPRRDSLAAQLLNLRDLRLELDASSPQKLPSPPGRGGEQQSSASRRRVINQSMLHSNVTPA